MNKKIISASSNFSKKYNFTFITHEFEIKQLWKGEDINQNKNWSMFEKMPGVYIMTNEDKVIYIGKSIQNTGSRLIEHLQNDDKMQYATDQTRIIIFSLENDKHITSALESYLIEVLVPIVNKKTG